MYRSVVDVQALLLKKAGEPPKSKPRLVGRSTVVYVLQLVGRFYLVPLTRASLYTCTSAFAYTHTQGQASPKGACVGGH